MATGWGTVGGRLPALSTLPAMHSHHSHRRGLAVLAAAATAALSVLAPAGAPAQPAPVSAQDLRALAATSSLAGTTAGRGPQNMQSPDARDVAAHARGASHTPAAAAGIYVPPRELAPVSEQAAAGSASTDARAVTPAAAATVADHGNGVDWATIALGIAGSLLLAGGIAAVASRRQRALRATH
jgi:hypothetical protein